VPGIFLAGKSSRRIGLTTLLSSVIHCLENVGASTPHNPIVFHGLLQGYIFYVTTIISFLYTELVVVMLNAYIQEAPSSSLGQDTLCPACVQIALRLGHDPFLSNHHSSLQSFDRS
jgi:hypothetical protein